MEVARLDPLYLFAGTLDRRVYATGWEYILDLKTGPTPKWGRYQTAAYDHLCGPYIKGFRKRAAVELHEDGSMATMRPHEDMNDWNYFLAMLTTTRARQQSGVSQIDLITGEAKWNQRAGR